MLSRRFASSKHPMRDALLEVKDAYDEVAYYFIPGKAKIMSDAEAAPKECSECARKEVESVREACRKVEQNQSEKEVDLECALDALQKSRLAFEKLNRARRTIGELHMQLERQVQSIRRAGRSLDDAVDEHRGRISEMEDYYNKNIHI